MGKDRPDGLQEIVGASLEDIGAQHPSKFFKSALFSAPLYSKNAPQASSLNQETNFFMLSLHLKKVHDVVYFQYTIINPFNSL